MEECEGKWRVGKREPNEIPDVLTGVGWGIVVGAQESWAHGENISKAKAPSLRKDRSKGTQRTRKLYTGGYPWSWRNVKERFV